MSRQQAVARLRVWWCGRVRGHPAIEAKREGRLIYAKCLSCNRLFYATPEGLLWVEAELAKLQAMTDGLIAAIREAFEARHPREARDTEEEEE